MEIIPWLVRSFPRMPLRGRLLGRWLARRPAGQREALLPGGARLPCDLANPYEAMVWLGAEETEDLAALAALLRPGDVFVDVGACLGLWALSAAARVAPGGSVHAFEPNPATAGRLRENVSRNGMDAVVQVYAHALGAVSGEAALDLGAAPNLSRLHSAGSVRVPVRALDDCLRVEMPVRGIKVDVEGGEADVLRGAARILSEHRPWICAEFTARDHGALGGWPVHGMLAADGWRPFLAPLTPGAPWQPITPEWTVPTYENVFFLPNAAPPTGAVRR